MSETSDTTIRNETLEAIERRHSVRTFLDTPVPESHIDAVLRAANQAPSAHNEQSWRFIIVKGNKKQELAHMVIARAAEFPRPAAALLRMAARSILSAPVVIAVANTGDLIQRGTELFQVDPGTANLFFRTMEIQSSAAAVQNLLVAATSLGLSTVWLGILFLLKDEVLSFLGEPQGEFMAVIPVGYASHAPSGPAKLPLGQVVKLLEA